MSTTAGTISTNVSRCLTHFTGCTAKSEIPNDDAAARPNLMPIVRDASYSSLVALHLRSRGTEYEPSLFAPITDGLVVSLAYDTEHSIMQVNQETFDRWGIPFDEALAAATVNLRDRTDTRLLVETGTGSFRSRWGDSYDSARILLTDLIYRLPLDGDPHRCPIAINYGLPVNETRRQCRASSIREKKHTSARTPFLSVFIAYLTGSGTATCPKNPRCKNHVLTWFESAPRSITTSSRSPSK